MAPRTLSAAPAAAARSSSGAVGLDADRYQDDVGGAGEVAVGEDAQAVPVGRNPADGAAGVNIDLMPGQLVVDERPSARQRSGAPRGAARRA